MPIQHDAAADAVARTGLVDTLERARPTDLRIDVASNAAAVDALRSEWLKLEAVSAPTAVFQSHAQIRAWARHFAPADDAGRLHIAVVRQRDRAVLILPLAISGPATLRIARMAGDPIAQYSELLTDPAGDLLAAFDAAVDSVKDAGADAIVFRRVRDDSVLLRLARRKFRPPATRRVAPFADLSGFSDYPQYLNSLSRGFRHKLRNATHKLEKAGDYRFELMPGGKSARAAISEAIDLKRKWLVRHGAISSAFTDLATKACLLDLAEDAATGSVVARLSINGETAAVRFGFEHRGTHFGYLSAYDERFAHLSPGKLLLDFVLSGFRERTFDVIDMLPPGSADKREWCDREVGVADYTLPLTETGRLYAEAYQENIRPGLQWTWAHLPQSLRSLLAALLLRL